MTQEKNYITPQGFAKLKEELRELLYEKRPAIVEKVAWAASNGDRSENGDYIYGKQKLREIDRRVHFLNRRLDIAEVVDPAQIRSEKVLFGATVTVLDPENIQKVYQLVGADETDAQNGKISWKSPIGKAVLQKQVGDVVSLKTPKGETELEIIKIEFL